MQPTRLAVLISSQTRKGQHLVGVERDADQLRQYFKSPNGGHFYDREIITLNSPTVSEVLNILQNAIADYVYVHFSGHGYTTQYGANMLCLIDGDLQDQQLLNQSPRQLVVIDACRKRQESGAIGGIRWPEERYFSFTGYSAARAYFDNCISESPFGKMILHATYDNGYSYEDEKRIGGHFTLAMLDVVSNYQNSKQFGIIPVETVFADTRDMLQNRNVKQIPTLYRTGFLKVPFGIVSPEFIYQMPRKENQKPATYKTNNEAVVLVCLALLVVGIAVSS